MNIMLMFSTGHLLHRRSRHCQNTYAFSDSFFCRLLQGLRFSGQNGSVQVVFRHYGVPDLAVVDVMQLHHGSTAAVSNRIGHTEAFDTTCGVLQRDTLSPILFI